MVIKRPALQDYLDVLVGRLQDFPVEFEIHCLRDPIHQFREVLAEHGGDDQAGINVLFVWGEAGYLCIGQANAAAGGAEDRSQLYCCRGCIKRWLPLIGLMYSMRDWWL
jgi:hypothetical protein